MTGTRKLARRQKDAADDTPRERLTAFIVNTHIAVLTSDHHLTLIDEEPIGRFQRAAIKEGYRR